MRALSPLAAVATLSAASLCPALAQERVMSAAPSFEQLVKAPAPRKPEGAPAPLAEAYDALLKGQYAKARALAEPLAKKGDAAAHHLLGYLHEKGLGVRPDIAAALRHYGDAAVAGNADAQVALGLLAFEGGGVYPDYERAAGWFRLAAAQGDPRADVRLGIMYAEGVGVRKSPVAAAHHFAKAAGRGDADGAFYLGLSFLNGDGIPQSYQKAAASFADAAAKGHGEAAYHLSLIYDAPVLGAPDTDKAAKLMRRAAEAGYAPAFAAMGLIVHRGDAPGIAADWFEMGARAGDPQSAFLYAVALSEGDGRAKDVGAAMAVIEKLIASPETSEPLKAQARALRQAIAQRTNGPLTLRN
jgi:hypothetical protein